MSRKRPAVDLIADEVAAMTFPMEITAVDTEIVDGTEYQVITVCDLRHSQPGFEITIGSDTYLIKDISEDPKKIYLKQLTPVITAGEFELYPPFYFHGTIIHTAEEFSQKSKQDSIEDNRVPMVYFREHYTERHFDFAGDARDREIRFSLYFLTKARHKEWLPNDAYKYAVRPMTRLMEDFIERLRKHPGLFDLVDFEFESENWARLYANTDVKKNLWADELAGVEWRPQPLTLLKCSCGQCCKKC